MPRVILSRPDRLGDVIITSALLPVLHRSWPNTEFYWLTMAAYQPLFHQHPLLSGLIAREQAADRIRSLRPEALIHFQPDSQLEKIARDARCRHQIGYCHRWWSGSLTEACPDDRPYGLKHEAEYALDLAAHFRPLPDAIPPLAPSLRLSPLARESLKLKLPGDADLGGYFVVNPTAYSESLRWPWNRFLEVCQWMNQTQQLRPILISGDPQDPSIENLAAALKSEGLAHLNLAGQLDLAELGWLLHGVKLHLARNTGTSHLAAAVGCPQVELFIRSTGRYSVTRWKSLSPRAFQIHASLRQNFGEPNPHFWSRCAEAISVRDVCAQIQQVLSHVQP